MILKGNIRAGGQELARHLMNDRHEIDPEASHQPATLGNERVELAELRGFVADDLAGAFREIEAVATGTNCTKPIYSLSINPSQPMSRDQYGLAIDCIEKKLGLEGQARAVVFHVKQGREHCHVAWSRIDLERMQARHNAFDRQKLREVARELVRDFGHPMPRHLGEDRGADRFADRFNAITLPERGQAERSGLDPAERKQAVTDIYRQSDSAAAFRAALSERGLTLAQGDRRGLVLVDGAGDVHSLNRQIEGATAKQIKTALNLDSLRDLPTVQEAKERQAERTRAQATREPQTRADPAEQVKGAEDTLQAVREAHTAEQKALRGAYREQLAAIRAREAERIEDSRKAIKEAYRPEWRDLFKRQREEARALAEAVKTPARRLTALLSGRAGDAFDFDNRGTLAGAFKFIVRGHIDTAKMEKAHGREKRELGDRQRLAEREEVRAIRQDAKDSRADAREQHTAALDTARRDHAERKAEAAKALETARRLAEEQARDLSRGEVADRQGRKGFGFSRQGFSRQGGMSFGRSRDEREDDERQLKPPTQAFNPK